MVRCCRLSNVSEPREFFNFHKKFQIIEDKPQWNDNIGRADNDLVIQLETTFITLEQQCSQLFIKLLRLLSLSIGMENIDFFANKAKSLVDKSVNSYNVVRTLYYPSLSSLILGQENGNSTIVGNGMRFSEHTDWGIFTIVFRDGVDGLEVIIYDDVIILPIQVYNCAGRYEPMMATGQELNRSQKTSLCLLEIF